VAVTLIIAGLAAVVLQRRALVTAIDDTLVARAEDVSAMIAGGNLPDRLTIGGGDDALIQVVDENGVVLASTGDIEGAGPVAEIRPGPGATAISTVMLANDDEEFRLVAHTTVADDQTFTIYTAATLESVEEAAGTLTFLVAVGVPLLIGWVGITVWIIVGRTLRPVEAIRAEVASITDRELNRRVPASEVNDEIGRLAKTMNQMLVRLEQSSIQQHRFVADASHELRSPLAAIRSQLEVDLAHPDHADWPQTHAEVLDEALRLQRLVDGLLLLARADAGALSTPRDSVDVDDLVFEQVKQLQVRANLTIDTTRVSGAQVRADVGGLTQVIRNLLENASRYAVSRIDIGLTESKGIATLTIDDDGPGIAEEERERVFERFTRLDEARDRAHGGVGLGLAIARDVTQNHGGTIQLEHSPLGGARFVVELPIDQGRATRTP
jgi:signal transduction histidine kinase